MNGLLFLFGSAFVVALSGALMPGPVLTATISEVLKRGFRAGPLIIVGHAILEITLLVLVIAGLGPWIVREDVKSWLGVGGGVLLIAMGAQMAWTAQVAADDALQRKADPRSAVRGPVLTGILMSLSNPYWALWWATIGLNYVALALKSGFLGLASFYSGHIMADLAWYSAVSAAVASGRKLCPRAAYIVLIMACGLALVALGAYFLSDGLGRLV
ncbi:MAG: hypothetical protein BWK77_05170 [Verrucomicrobia bacterium A1]|nr:MAG: hypothetical protein BWK77_05170 [Verrucomicrobia bacterium A1]